VYLCNAATRLYSLVARLHNYDETLVIVP
jgi:hypothetical protein